MLNFVLFAGSYGGGAFLAVFRSPSYAFMVYQIVYFMNPLERWWSYMIPSLSYSFFTVVLMAGVFAKDFKQHNKNSLLAAPQFKWIYLIAAAYFMTTFYAVLPAANSDGVTNYIKMAIILSIAYKIVDTSAKLDGVLAAFIGGAAYIGYLARQSGRDYTGRVEGIGTVDSPDSNGIAAAIAPTLILGLYYFWFSKSKIIKFGIVIACAFTANAIVLINSRASFLAIIASVGYFFMFLFFSKMQKKGQKGSAILLILLGLVAAANVIDETAIKRFQSIKEQKMDTKQETGKTRVFFWIAAMEMAKDHPFGAGVKAFEYYAPEYLPQNLHTGASRNRSVHSSWFEALTEVGYPGFIFLVMMVFSSYNATRKCRAALMKKNSYEEFYKIVAIESAFIAYLVAMSFMNRFRAEIFYWCILFTACAYNIYILNPAPEPEEGEEEDESTKSAKKWMLP